MIKINCKSDTGWKLIYKTIAPGSHSAGHRILISKLCDAGISILCYFCQRKDKYDNQKARSIDSL